MWHTVAFHGLVGLTHNYAGLSSGNLASEKNIEKASNPKAAFLQGLEHAYQSSKLGQLQAVLPPQERPNIKLLRGLGYKGREKQILENADEHDLRKSSSASAMWAANSATIIPAIDSDDGKMYITPANLEHFFHRAGEVEFTKKVLKKIFSKNENIVVNEPIKKNKLFGDEGAANHMRFAVDNETYGHHLFVYGMKSGSEIKPNFKPARQTLEASKMLAKVGHLREKLFTFTQQNPWLIDKGIFHNDVIGVNGYNIWLTHELAYVNERGELNLEDVVNKVKKNMNGDLKVYIAENENLPINDVVNSYVFNSRIIGTPKSGMKILAAEDVKNNKKARAYLEDVANEDNPINEIVYFNLRESMDNGGGPACLRLRVDLTDEDINLLNGRVMLDEELYKDLKNWGEKHYRDNLVSDDLRDIKLIKEGREALNELTQILKLGNIYDFQK